MAVFGEGTLRLPLDDDVNLCNLTLHDYTELVISSSSKNGKICTLFMNSSNQVTIEDEMEINKIHWHLGDFIFSDELGV